MNKVEAKQSARNRLEEYLLTITEKKGNQYICPLCGSGTGKNATNISVLFAEAERVKTKLPLVRFHLTSYTIIVSVVGSTEIFLTL